VLNLTVFQITSIAKYLENNNDQKSILEIISILKQVKQNVLMSRIRVAIVIPRGCGIATWPVSMTLYYMVHCGTDVQ
jgi:hypothetical protein